MKCLFCDKPATVHVVKAVNLEKREAHLCERCARERNLLADPPGPPIGLKALVGLFAGPLRSGPKAAAPESACPACGLTYAGFKAEGRFGCAHDYDAFAAALTPLLERVHRAAAHAGKLPAARRRAAALADLRARMAAAVAAEEYEAAAGLRDQIRRTEAEAEGTPG